MMSTVIQAPLSLSLLFSLYFPILIVHIYSFDSILYQIYYLIIFCCFTAGRQHVYTKQEAKNKSQYQYGAREHRHECAYLCTTGTITKQRRPSNR